MPISTCPVATVAAPIAHVWEMLISPESYSNWWDARTERIEPPGKATPGQVVYASSRALGRRWPVTTTVNAVDSERHALDLTTTLPLGITIHNHILCQPLDVASCRLSFGWDFIFPPGWRGQIMERVMAGQCHRGVADALARLKRAAEKVW